LLQSPVRSAISPPGSRPAKGTEKGGKGGGCESRRKPPKATRPPFTVVSHSSANVTQPSRPSQALSGKSIHTGVRQRLSKPAGDIERESRHVLRVF
jgi:hypothetical protein